jgi:5'-nucleotidase
MPKGIALNVNFPAVSNEPIKGIKVCRQARAKWQEMYDERHDPYRRKYYWMAGNFVNFETSENNDEWAIKNNYVSMVPCKFDLTADHLIEELGSRF